MKANRIAVSLAALALLGLGLGGCVAERKVAPAPAPRPVLRPAPPLPVVAPPADWRDAEFTPGDWSHRIDAAGSVASYGQLGGEPLLALRCERMSDRAASRIVLTRAGTASGQVPLSVITTNTSRAFTASAQDGPAPSLAVSLTPRDPILDAVAFSRGRWAIEVPGLSTLTLPAWPEVGRVIEDCR